MLSFRHNFARESTPLCRLITTLHLESERGIREVSLLQTLPMTNTRLPISFSFMNHDPPARQHATAAFTKPANVGTTPPFLACLRTTERFQGKALGDRLFSNNHFSSYKASGCGEQSFRSAGTLSTYARPTRMQHKFLPFDA